MSLSFVYVHFTSLANGMGFRVPLIDFTWRMGDVRSMTEMITPHLIPTFHHSMHLNRGCQAPIGKAHFPQVLLPLGSVVNPTQHMQQQRNLRTHPQAEVGESLYLRSIHHGLFKLGSIFKPFEGRWKGTSFEVRIRPPQTAKRQLGRPLLLDQSSN